MGYHQAGFDDIIGIDIAPQPNFPFTFIQGDALDPPVDLAGFDLIHASPPCQAYTTMNNRWGSSSPDLLAPTRMLLDSVGGPYVIENVLGARRLLPDAVMLTGEQFGLTVHRPRLFAPGRWWFLAPSPVVRQRDPVAVYGKQDGRLLWTRTDGSEHRVASLEEASRAMGIDWMTWDEIREAIPPAYTRWIGEQFLHQHATG